MTDPIIDYYTDSYNEDQRHDDPFGLIQELRTKELVARYLGDVPLSVLDIGGATGVYAFWLADLGHQVSLLDVVPRHTAHVEEMNVEREKKLHHILTGDARNYALPGEFNVILLHGPLYHILERADRVAMLAHLKQYLVHGGVLLGFAINRYAGYFYGVRSGAILNTDYQKMVLQEVVNGVREREPGWYFHTPDELAAEFEEAGLQVTDLKSVTTQVWMLPEIEAHLDDPAFLETILKLAKAMEDETAIGQDLMCVGMAD